MTKKVFQATSFLLKCFVENLFSTSNSPYIKSVKSTMADFYYLMQQKISIHCNEAHQILNREIKRFFIALKFVKQLQNIE